EASCFNDRLDPLAGYGGLISTGLTSLRPVGTVNDGEAIGVCTLSASVPIIPPIVSDIFVVQPISQLGRPLDARDESEYYSRNSSLR
uniref:hypothetical protein n=1 Tax=Candidatus Borrarchaeum sp. TaxID=2846742 RepID=UPI00257DB92C